jgi:peptide/nickel transport system permease protein
VRSAVIVFVVRRVIVSFFVLLVASFLVYVLVASSGNPLGYLANDQSNNKAQKIAEVIERLHLDESVPRRYLGWLGGVARCAVPGGECDLGMTKNGQQVSDLLGQAVGTTLRLVLAATILAIVIGITIGIVSALRQYSGFDYTITFSAFLFFSLPLFWVAVLLKQYVAIRFNTWLYEPVIGWTSIVVLSALSALTWQAIVAGNRRRRLLVAGVAFAVTAVILYSISVSQWFAQPALGLGAVSLLSLGSALAVTQLTSGLQRRKVLDATIVTAVVGVISSFVVRPLLEDPTWWVIFLLLLVAIAVGLGIGYLMGGLDRRQAAAASALTAVLTGLWIFVDHALNAVPEYSNQVSGRLIPTIGSNTPDLQGDFWVRFVDSAAHLILPTLAIMLISLASYSRYSRASMLETMNQDYVRTARSKGLTERTVIMRHAFRNALIPVTTIMALDFGAVLAGAVVTETVFGWQGMGRLFVTSLQNVDPNPVMGYFVVTAVAIVIFNMVADIVYAYLDPRIRLS